PRFNAGNLSAANLTITLNGQSVTGRFQKTALYGGGNAIVGRLENLEEGNNTLKVAGPKGESVTKTLTDFPRSGPIFSDLHQKPFFCQFQSFGLAATGQSECSAATKVDYFYLSAQTNTFLPYDPAAERPAD